MSETTLTGKEVEAIAAYIQLKERMIAALSHAVRNAESPIYAAALNQLLTYVVYDAMPGAINCQKFFPNLYALNNQAQQAPAAEEKKEEE